MANTASKTAVKSTARKTASPAAKQAQPKSTAKVDSTPRPVGHAGDREFWGTFVPKGYELTSWLRAHYALIKKSKGSTVEGQPWLTVTEFGATKFADKGSQAEANGRERAKWDPKSAEAAKSAPVKKVAAKTAAA